MKRIILLSLVSCLMAMVAQAATIDVNGTAYPVDTLACYQVGPGTTYTRFNVTMGTTVHRMYLYTIDLTNPYVKLEEAHGDKLGVTKLMSRMHQDMDSVGHRPIGSVNCNFWVVASQSGPGSTWEGWLGQSFAGTAKDGMMLTEPMDWNEGHGDRGYVMIDELNRALIRNMYFSGRLIKGMHSRAIRDVNRPSVNYASNEVCLYNRHIGTTRTIDETAVEYIFEPVAGQQWSINDTMTCVVRTVNTTGGTTLVGEEGALQCRGTGKNWVENYLAVGDTFQIKLGMYSASTSASRNADELCSDDSIAPHIMQMVTGNCLVMADGRLTHRNTNEGYNNQNYPRTMLATNNDGTRFWMLVSEKPGNYTAEMCGILRNDGATWAAGMDGGGSAQFNLHGTILNPTTEASPRAVANAFFVVSTAPDDSLITRLENTLVDTILLDAYTTFTPLVRAYNQYGNIVHEGFDYTLSCTPANLGTISSDGRSFIAGPLPIEGILTVTAGLATLDIPLIVQAGDWQMRLDSVVVDHRPYDIEVLTMGTHPSPVPADVLHWTVADETIALVEGGEVRGLQNGRTTLTGVLGDRQLTQVVDVQIADSAIMPWVNFLSHMDAPFFVVTASAGFEPVADCVMGNEPYSIMDILFTYAATRAAFVRFETDEQTWGLPDSLIFYVQPSCPIKTIEIHGHGNTTAEDAILKVDGPQAGEMMRIAVSPSQFKLDAADHATYPFHFTGMKFLIDTKAGAGNHEIRIAAPYMQYSAWMAPETDAVEEVSMLLPTSRPSKYIENGQVIIQREGRKYNVLGFKQ
ncbi:MAG: phosphodiester glycosidase family protein [Paludibacteraceae bacterium]|nr:phosphodiester glycosidase family protein [Paludibacteraceae bacterium]